MRNTCLQLFRFASIAFYLILAACGGGGGGGDGNSTSQNEGSSVSPVNLGVVSSSMSRASSVDAWGTSYYQFQTGSIPATYIISLTGTMSDLSWSLYSNTFMSLQDCDNSLSAVDEACTTVALAANTVYYLIVDEWDNVAGTFTLSVSVSTINADVDSLGFRVIDAEYSKSLDRIIMVSSQPSNQLHIYDPVAKADTTVNLNLVPTSVSVSPDGLYAAVGHNAWVSYVNLSTATLVNTFPTTADVIDIVLAGNGYVYAFPRIDQWERIRSINLTTGVETLHTGGFIRAGTRAKLHPDGIAIYGADNGLSPSDIEKYSITGGTAAYLYDSPYHGTYPMCGDLWMSEDGLRIFTKCGNVFRASPNRYSSGTTPEDMTYNGALQNLASVQHLTHSSAAGLVAAVPANTFSNSQADREVQLFNYDFLTFNSKVTLPYFVLSSTSAFPGHGRFVFYNSAGTAYFVVIQADSSSGMLNDYGIVTY